MTMNSIDARVGARVKNLRLAQGLNPAAAARRLEISTLSYLMREDGDQRFSAAEIRAISGFLDAPLDQIYNGFLDTPKVRASRRH